MDMAATTFAASAPRLQKGFGILDNDHGVIRGAIYSLDTAAASSAALSGELWDRKGDARGVAERLAGEIEGFDEPCCDISRMKRIWSSRSSWSANVMIQIFVRSCDVKNGGRSRGLSSGSTKRRPQLRMCS